jgi:hypothetical protein
MLQISGEQFFITEGEESEERREVRTGCSLLAGVEANSISKFRNVHMYQYLTGIVVPFLYYMTITTHLCS